MPAPPTHTLKFTTEKPATMEIDVRCSDDEAAEDFCAGLYAALSNTPGAIVSSEVIPLNE